MSRVIANLYPVVTAFLVVLGVSAAAQTPEAEELLDRLAEASPEEAQQIEDQLAREWAKSGSAAMDLLLQRGKDALEEGEFDVAVDHLSALTDHAPDFAEGWNLRAAAFFEKGQYGLALDDLSQALRLNPRHFGALIGLAVLLEQTGSEKAALEAYRAVQAIHPHHEQVASAVERLEQKVGGQDI